ncbi:MAG: TetR family transcriptional regulator [Clostridiales bacterium]|nr:TetR family transcriptional regulator [Clostridiales bacterium]
MPQSKKDKRQKNVTPFSTHGDSVFRNEKNRQINQVTRESLSIALIYLMNEKPFEKISITELVDRAGVSRTAFYRNYESKEELLSEIGKSLITRIHELNGKESSGKLSYEWYLELFKTIKEHKESFLLFTNANLTAKMLFNRSTFVDVVFPSSESTERYRLIAEEGATQNVINTWFSEGMKESPEEMAELCANLINKG